MKNESPEISVFKPNHQDGFIYAILMAFILTVFAQNICSAQVGRVSGGYGGSQLTAPVFIPQDSTVTAPIDAVWMPLDTFATYWWKRSQYDQLSVLVIDYRQQVDSITVAYDRAIAICQSSVANREQQTAILQEQNDLLRKQLRRTKWKHRITTGSTMVLLITLLLI